MSLLSLTSHFTPWRRPLGPEYLRPEHATYDYSPAAALSLTTLYRSSKTASKRAYNAGYSAACHDLLSMIQQGVSTDADPSREVTIGRIMDYIEARLDAIKTREEEEDEEEERAAKGVAGPSVPKPKPASPTLGAAAPRREQVRIDQCYALHSHLTPVVSFSKLLRRPRRTLLPQ